MGFLTHRWFRTAGMAGGRQLGEGPSRPHTPRSIGRGRQLVDPGRDQTDLLLRQRRFSQGHGRLLLTPKVLDQWAGLGIAGQDGGAVEGASPKNGLRRFQHQAAIVGTGIVAGETAGLQDGFDLGPEAGRGVFSRACEGRQPGEKSHPD